jgi:hypothetical protein
MYLIVLPCFFFFFFFNNKFDFADNTHSGASVKTTGEKGMGKVQLAHVGSKEVGKTKKKWRINHSPSEENALSSR